MIRTSLVHAVTCRTNGCVGIVAVSLVKQWSIDHSQSNSRAIKCIIERCGTNFNGTRSSPRSSFRRDRGEARACKIERGEECEGMWYFLRRGFFPRPKVIFSPSQRRRRRRVIAYEFQLQKTRSVAASRTVSSQWWSFVSSRLLFYTVTLHHWTLRGVFTFIIARGTFLPLKIIGQRLVSGDY